MSSALTHLEIVSALTRRRKEIVGFEKAVAAFRDDWEAFIVWAIDGDVMDDAVDLIGLYKLRAADAIHLVTVLSVGRHTKDKLMVVSSDQELLSAAKKTRDWMFWILRKQSNRRLHR